MVSFSSLGDLGVVCAVAKGAPTNVLDDIAMSTKTLLTNTTTTTIMLTNMTTTEITNTITEWFKV